MENHILRNLSISVIFQLIALLMYLVPRCVYPDLQNWDWRSLVKASHEESSDYWKLVDEDFGNPKKMIAVRLQ